MWGQFGSRKYRVTKLRQVWTPFRGIFAFKKHIILHENGCLFLSSGFEWDGPSGPTLDDDQNMLASAAHDALYTLGFAGKLGREWRKRADVVLRQEMIRAIPKDASWWRRVWMRARALYYYVGVRLGGNKFGSRDK